jgi:diguanylate cyclase (GGDEF)-like protein/PAS domain S-box-containing protein
MGRERGLRSLLLGIFILGTISLTPGLARAFEGDAEPVFLVQAAMVAASAVLYGSKGLRSRALFAACSLAALAFSCASFALQGPLSEGMIWLMAAPLVSSMLLGAGPGFATLFAAFGFGLSLMLIQPQSLAAWQSPLNAQPNALFISAFAIDAFLVAALALFTREARKASMRSHEAERELAAAQARLKDLDTELALNQAAKALAQDEYTRQRSLLNAMIEHSRDLVMLLDANARIQLASPAALPLLGLEPEELKGRDLFSFVSEEEREDQRAMFSSSLVAGLPTFSSLFSLKNRAGAELPIEAIGSNYLYNPDISGVLLTLRDMTSQKEAEAKAEFFEHYDPLTLLPNRESFMHEAERAVTIARNRNRVFGVMAIGLDRFKRINDLYGTEAGDRVLKEAAQALRGAFRNDDVVARYRGDKFFALFPDIRSQEHIKEIIAKAESAFDQLIRLDLGEEIKLSASIGVALYPNDARNAEDLVRNAETALYMAKESGRDRYRLFDAKLNGEILERQKIESALNTAISDKALLPYFQPKVDRNGFIVGAEALVRWKHPSGEIKSPGYFIDVAEKSGSIDSIGQLMLRMTCDMAASWAGQGLPRVPVSINLSPRQFGRDDLIEGIKQVLKASGLDPRLLEFEITESGIMENEREGIRKLLELKELGAAISIDDFGTGYSSFSKLKDYPIDTVKIDKSFIDPLPGDKRASIIASAIVDLAHTLSFTVVAEGVENAAQLGFLESIFCDAFQGYLFSRPVSEDDFKALLRAGKALRVC